MEIRMSGVPPYPGAPLWAKVLGFTGLALILLGVASFIAGRGPSGHRIHSGQDGGATPSSRVLDIPVPPAGDYR